MKQVTLNDFNWRYLFNTRRFLVTAIGCVVLSLVMVLAVIIPQFNQILTIQSKLTQEKKLLGQLQNKIQALSESQTLDLVNESKLIDATLPSHKPLLELMTSLNFVASWAQVSITDIQLSPGEISTESAQAAAPAKVTASKVKRAAPKAYQNLDVDIEVTGGLDQLNMFLKNVENTVPFSTVTKFTLSEIRSRASTGGSTIGTNNYKAELTISTYYFVQSINAALSASLTPVGNNEQQLLTKLKSYTILNQVKQKGIEGGGSDDLFGVESLGGSPEPQVSLEPDESD